MATLQRVGTGADATWTVVGEDFLPVEPIEEFLEFMRVARGASSHTVRSYAITLAGLWRELEQAGVRRNLGAILPGVLVHPDELLAAGRLCHR
ncbi:MAG: hypothetical protein ACYDEY_05605 [Acidimicrobiales bacterium]